MAAEDLKARYPIGTQLTPGPRPHDLDVSKYPDSPGTCEAMDRIWESGKTLCVVGHSSAGWLSVKIDGQPDSHFYYYKPEWVRPLNTKPITLHPMPTPTLKLDKKNAPKIPSRARSEINLAPEQPVEKKFAAEPARQSEVSLPAVLGGVTMMLLGIAGAKAGAQKLKAMKAETQQQVKGAK